jgi:hypothetical protein
VIGCALIVGSEPRWRGEHREALVPWFDAVECANAQAALALVREAQFEVVLVRDEARQLAVRGLYTQLRRRSEDVVFVLVAAPGASVATLQASLGPDALVFADTSTARAVAARVRAHVERRVAGGVAPGPLTPPPSSPPPLPGAVGHGAAVPRTGGAAAALGAPAGGALAWAHRTRAPERQATELAPPPLGASPVPTGFGASRTSAPPPASPAPVVWPSVASPPLGGVAEPLGAKAGPRSSPASAGPSAATMRPREAEGGGAVAALDVVAALAPDPIASDEATAIEGAWMPSAERSEAIEVRRAPLSSPGVDAVPRVAGARDATTRIELPDEQRRRAERRADTVLIDGETAIAEPPRASQAEVQAGARSAEVPLDRGATVISPPPAHVLAASSASASSVAPAPPDDDARTRTAPPTPRLRFETEVTGHVDATPVAPFDAPRRPERASAGVRVAPKASAGEPVSSARGTAGEEGPTIAIPVDGLETRRLEVGALAPGAPETQRVEIGEAVAWPRVEGDADGGSARAVGLETQRVELAEARIVLQVQPLDPSGTTAIVDGARAAVDPGEAPPASGAPSADPVEGVDAGDDDARARAPTPIAEAPRATVPPSPWAEADDVLAVGGPELLEPVDAATSDIAAPSPLAASFDSGLEGTLETDDGRAPRAWSPEAETRHDVAAPGGGLGRVAIAGAGWGASETRVDGPSTRRMELPELGVLAGAETGAAETARAEAVDPPLLSPLIAKLEVRDAERSQGDEVRLPIAAALTASGRRLLAPRARAALALGRALERNTAWSFVRLDVAPLELAWLLTESSPSTDEELVRGAELAARVEVEGLLRPRAVTTGGVTYAAPAGRPLDQALRGIEADDLGVSVGAALHLFDALASAIEALHGARLVHGALAPGFVWLADDGAPHVALGGLGRVLRAVEGAPCRVRRDAYVAPETLDEGIVDSRSDVYALGVIAWELLANDRLFLRIDTHETRNAIAAGASKALPDHVSPAIVEVVERLIALDPDQRPASVAEARRLMTRATTQGTSLRRSTGQIFGRLFGRGGGPAPRALGGVPAEEWARIARHGAGQAAR